MRNTKTLHILSIFVVLALLWAPGFRAAALQEPGPEGSGELQVEAGPVLRVPEDVGNLQDAISQVPNGGIIEMNSGTYNAPNGGFRISNLRKSFTIREKVGANVVLDGQGGRDILRIFNTDRSRGGLVIFQGLTFANGSSGTPGVAGGVSIQKGEAEFSNCTFKNNASSSNGSGGGILVAVGSKASFSNCAWEDNRAQSFGAGIEIQDGSDVSIYSSRFTNNRTNLPGHTPTSAGGAIHIGNSTVYVSNTKFEGNQAGYAGGAIYAIGTWADPVDVPRTWLTIENSTFTGNKAARDAGVSLNAPTEGGAIHTENQVLATINNATFITNDAQSGGAITLYRSAVNVSNSIFLGNRATGTSLGGYGGAISMTSNDTSEDGSNNRPVSRFSLRDSLIQGRYSNVTTTALGGGGIYAMGDFNRLYGRNGVSQRGDANANRTRISIDRVIFNDLDAVKSGSSGTGGAIFVDVTELNINNSILINSDAQNSGGSGGAVAGLNQSLINVTASTFSKNSAGNIGGAIYTRGATLNVSSSNLVENTANSGSAIFTGVMADYGLPATGVIQNNTISNNNGLAVYDEDRNAGPINDVRYNGNKFYTDQSGGIVYQDTVSGSKTVSQLNTLVVQRSGAGSTEKSQVNNDALGRAAIVGAILAVPPVLLDETNNTAYLGYAWSGGSATLDGRGVSGNAGVTTTNEGGTHTLEVNGRSFQVDVLKLSPWLYVPLLARQ